MRVLLVGARERDTEEDRKLVGDLIEQITREAPHTIIVSMLTHMGVGKFVKEKCLERDATGRYRFPFIESTLRVFTSNLDKSTMSDIYLARNSTPFDISDQLIYLAAEDRRGTMEDMLLRFQRASRPYLVLKPGDVIPENIVGA